MVHGDLEVEEGSACAIFHEIADVESDRAAVVQPGTAGLICTCELYESYHSQFPRNRHGSKCLWTHCAHTCASMRDLGLF